MRQTLTHNSKPDPNPKLALTTVFITAVSRVQEVTVWQGTIFQYSKQMKSRQVCEAHQRWYRVCTVITLGSS